MATMGERIVAARKAEGLNKSQLARKVGVAVPTVLEWESGVIAEIKTANLLKLCKALNRTTGWILQGREPEFPSKSPGYRYLEHENFNSVAVRERKSDYDNNAEDIDPRHLGKVPLISSVQAGSAALAIDNLEPGDAEEWYYCNAPHSEHTYALKVEGDSMESQYGKSYPAGCIVFVDPEKRGDINIGEAFVAKISGVDAVTLKALASDGNRAYLKPLNPQYPMIMEEFRPLGKVIGKWEF